MKPKTPQLTDAQLDAALRADQDGILPSSGFADDVMASIQRDAEAPAPIPFPWKRALPGLVVGVAALAGLFSLALLVIVNGIRLASHSAAPATAASWNLSLMPWLHSAAAPDVLWPLASLLLPLLCLLLVRRLIFSR